MPRFLNPAIACFRRRTSLAALLRRARPLAWGTAAWLACPALALAADEKEGPPSYVGSFLFMTLVVLIGLAVVLVPANRGVEVKRKLYDG